MRILFHILKKKMFSVIPYHLILRIIGVFYELKCGESALVSSIRYFWGYFSWDRTRKPFFLFRSLYITRHVILNKTNLFELWETKKVESMRLASSDPALILHELMPDNQIEISDWDELETLGSVPPNRFYCVNGTYIPRIARFLKKNQFCVDCTYYVQTSTIYPVLLLRRCFQLRTLQLFLKFGNVEILNCLPRKISTLIIKFDNLNCSRHETWLFVNKLGTVMSNLTNLTILKIKFKRKMDLSYDPIEKHPTVTIFIS